MLYHDREIVLYDVDINIVTVWKYLINATFNDIMQLPILEPGDSLHNYNLSNAEMSFLGFMINSYSNSPKLTATKRTDWRESKRLQIATDVTKVRHWKITQSDFRKIVVNEPATIMIDPPYEVMGRHYRKYLMPGDYSVLKDLVHTWPGQKIVCEDDRATWLKGFKPLVGLKGQSNNISVECVYTCEN